MVVVLSFLVAILLLLLVGRNPSGMFQAVLQAASGFDSQRGWNARFIGEWLILAFPLILCALSMGFSVRCGLFNLGAEGQYITGLTAAQFIALTFPHIFVLHLTVVMSGAIVAGALWGSIAGFLKVRFRVSEVLSTVMMNYIALYIHRLVTMKIPGSNIFRTPDFPATVSLSNSMLAAITNNSRLNNGLWFVVLAVIIYWLIMEKTAFDKPLSSGVRVKANITIAMAVSGAFAGLAGAIVCLGMFTHGRVLTGFDGYGFAGIAVALAGNSTVLGIAIVGLIFGILKSAEPLMHFRQIPGEIVSIITGLVVVFVSMRSGIQMFTARIIKLIMRNKEDSNG
jgi:simple sugar transport system permease protein